VLPPPARSPRSPAADALPPAEGPWSAILPRPRPNARPSAPVLPPPLQVLAAPAAEAVGGAFYGAGPQAASDVGELRRGRRTGEVCPGHRDIVFINRCCPKPEARLLLAALIWYYPYY